MCHFVLVPHRLHREATAQNEIIFSTIQIRIIIYIVQLISENADIKNINKENTIINAKSMSSWNPGPWQDPGFQELNLNIRFYSVNYIEKKISCL